MKQESFQMGQLKTNYNIVPERTMKDVFKERVSVPKKDYGKNILLSEEVLRDILDCLNQVPNKSVKNKRFKNTYEICSTLEKYLK